jgi:Ca-activated chloride channel family protein
MKTLTPSTSKASNADLALPVQLPACVEIDQIYHQNSARPLDCTYTFPLPAGVAVYRCELHVSGRVIRAKVEEKEKAQQIFREQKAAGRRAALVETERDNLFTLSLGNVQPGDLIVVRFAWFQVLDRIAGGLPLMVPTCPGVR